MTSEKVRHYHATHEKCIVFLNEYRAPRKSYGTRIKIEMVADENDQNVFHEIWDFTPKRSKIIEHEIMRRIRKIIDILNDPQYGHSTPHTIQIDEKGICHLLQSKLNGTLTDMDMILHECNLDWVKVAR